MLLMATFLAIPTFVTFGSNEPWIAESAYRAYLYMSYLFTNGNIHSAQANIHSAQAIKSIMQQGTLDTTWKLWYLSESRTTI